MGAICAMTGILVIAMPIPIIVNNFTRQYQRLKPASKYWEEFQEKTQPNHNNTKQNDVIVGLYDLVDLNENYDRVQNNMPVQETPETEPKTSESPKDNNTHALKHQSDGEITENGIMNSTL